MDNIKVSISYITYNQENYIRDAIDSFLMQEIDFPIEILIHDDASTDDTVKIIKEYENKYPDIIKPIYQMENQYSKNIDMNNINIKRAKGEYIALCDGDDYWIDPYKLQKQVNYMDNNPDCTFCFTNGRIIDEEGKLEERRFIPYCDRHAGFFDNNNKIYNVGELALLDFIPTASFFFRKSSTYKFPEFYYKQFPAEDIKISLLLTSQGYSYYINDDTCIYRTNVPGSIMTQWKSFSQEELFNLNQGYIDLLELVDEYNDYKYHGELTKAKIPREFGKSFVIGDKTILKDRSVREFLKETTIKYRMKAYLALYFPKSYILLKRVIKNKRSS